MEVQTTDEQLKFHEMGLDDRLLKSIADIGWSTPTLIQEKAIPLALAGKDVLARARTGSGKTAAFAIPVINKILTSKENSVLQCIKAIILTPTKELCQQAYNNINMLCTNCSREVRCIDISGQIPLKSQKPLLMEKPDIVISTPSRLIAHLKAGNITLRDTVEMLVIDEADLLFSFGYEDDIKELIGHLPKIYQAFLMSATLNDEVSILKKLILHNAVILKLEESQLPEASHLIQYHIKCEDEEKFVLIYALIKLKLIRGKSIIFVNSIDRCYKVKLFLEQFAISSCILNSELPVNSRCQIVEQFNRGMYDIIIAADELTAFNSEVRKMNNKHKGKRIKMDKESGVARGIDFKHISNVINFDFPATIDAYVHRVGRTARGKTHGTALSFVAVSEMALLNAVEKKLESQDEGENRFKPYNFKMDEIDGFRTRAEDARRAVTKVAIREARLKEIKQEMLHSSRLKSYFEDHTRDLQLLRHDKTLHTASVQEHMQHIPDYLVPKTLRHMPNKFNKNKKKTIGNRNQSKTKRKFNKSRNDPLKSFKPSSFKKK